MTGFKKFYIDEVISCTGIVPIKARQNEIVERMNRMLHECARSMRLNGGLPKVYFGQM